MPRAPAKAALWLAPTWALAILPLHTVAQPAPSNMAAVATTDDEFGWLDGCRDRVFNTLQGRVTSADLLFADPEEDRLAISNSTFEVQIAVELEYDGKIRVRFDPDLDASLNLPHMEQRWKLFLNTLSPDDLSDTTILDDNSDLHAGLTRVFRQSDWTKLDLSAGIKWRSSPTPFGRIEYKQILRGKQWKIFPRERIFWVSDDGFGFRAALQMDYWPRDRVIIRSDSSATVSESSRGVEWEQSLSVGYIIEGDENNRRHAFGGQIGVSGHADDSDRQIDRYRLSFVYRRPFLREWMCINFTPEFEYVMDNEILDEGEDCRFVTSFRVGLDMLLSAK